MSLYLSELNDEQGRQLDSNFAPGRSSDVKSGKFRGRVAG